MKNKMVVEFDSLEDVYSDQFSATLWSLFARIDRRVRGIERGEGNKFVVATSKFTIRVEMEPEQIKEGK